ncbi:MAG: hypothetical protein JRJ38_04100 [Deltaproteobacteria bacterium]|nr:hypothetical protein [Deltaproteobacteria bacterium]
MKKASCFTVIFLTVVLTICLFGTQGTAGEKIYQMKGEITAIESAYNTVVIEVPMGKRMFTVAGPLSSEAILKRGGQCAGLTDFVVGDQVTVKWRGTDKGHIIEMLKGN